MSKKLYTQQEVAVMQFLIERLGGDMVNIVRGAGTPEAEDLLGFSIGVDKSFAIRDLLEAALSTDAEPVAWLLEANNTAYVFYPHEKERGEKSARLQNVTLKPLYAAPPAPSVAVKALEWSQFTHRNLDLNADSIAGAYTIRPSAGNKFPVYLWVPGAQYDDARLKPFDEVETAKAAAQTHHDARIRSALSEQVQDVEKPTTDMKALQAWVYQQRVSLQTNDPDYVAKYGVWKAIGAQIRAMLPAAPAAKLEGKP
jgi:hypothetical protein